MRRAFVLLVSVCLLLALQAPGAQQAHPNIVFVLTDDLDSVTFQNALDAGLLPNIKARIMDVGAVADNYFTVQSECCPARARLVTSQYPQSNLVYKNGPPYGGVTALAEATTLPVWLQAAGYRTMHVGKWLNLYGLGGTQYAASSGYSEQHVPPGWTLWQGLLDNGTYTDYEHRWNMSLNGGTPVILDDKPAGQVESNYLTDNVTLHALSGMVQVLLNQPVAKPFYMELTPTTPHFHIVDRSAAVPLPLNKCPAAPTKWGITALSPPRYAGTVHLPLPRSASFNEDASTLALKPPPANTAPQMSAADIACAELAYQGRIEQLRAVDDQVGLVMLQLDQAKQTANTVLCLSSDNGYLQGDHRLVEKLWPYERSIRVPLACSGPGIVAHHIATMLTDADTAVTFAEFAGATPTLMPDGRSYAGLLRGTGTLARNAMPLVDAEAGTIPIDGGVPQNGVLIPAVPFAGVRVAVPSIKFIHHQSGFLELYHLDTDPDELHNLASDPATANERAQLDAITSTLATCHGTACVAAEISFTITP